MGGVTSRTRGTVRHDHRTLAERLRENSSELEEAIFDQICAAENSASQSPPPMRGVRSVVQSALKHGIDSVELGQQDYPPPAVIDHARKAAWRSVPLQTLYDRYLTGYSVFKHFLLRESDSVEIVQQVQGSLDVGFQQLTRAVAEEHKQAHQKRTRSSDIRRLERVEELLSGKLLEAPDLRYPLDGTHVGIVASGPEISSTIRQLFQPFGSRILLISPEPNKVWAWIVVRQDLDSSDLSKLLARDLPPELCVSIGEPASGLSGWRLTHCQAEAAFDIALNRGSTVLLYGEVAVLVALARDALLKKTLSTRYLAPLTHARDGGAVLRDTLRAYFAAGRNSRSAAAVLGVARQTVANRLRQAEDRFGQPLSECADAVDAALRLEELGFLGEPLENVQHPT